MPGWHERLPVILKVLRQTVQAMADPTQCK